MARIGQFVTDAKAGAYCRITLDSGEKIMVNHEKGGFRGGRVIIDHLKLLGLSSNRVFGCDLASDEGKRALRFLTRNAQPNSVEATPLRAFVEFLRTSQSLDEVKVRCSALMALARASDVK